MVCVNKVRCCEEEGRQRGDMIDRVWRRRGSQANDLIGVVNQATSNMLRGTEELVSLI